MKMKLIPLTDDVSKVRRYLIRHLPGKVVLFDALVAEAGTEAD